MDEALKNFIIFSDEKATVKVLIDEKNQTLWLNQKQISQLFDVDRSVITKHILNIYESEELDEKSTCANFAQVRSDGTKVGVKHYNLDMIIAVGYRVNSYKATKFRKWATSILKEFIIKGFVLDDERLKQGSTTFGVDYFKELLERVHSIRASERRIWQQITDIFAECSIDYDKNSQITKNFYANVQNKFHYAITGFTAAEIIFKKADKNALNMGLSTWKTSPNGRILKSDVVVAKNYLSKDEIKSLEQSVSGFFDYIERIIQKKQTFSMDEFASCVDKFLSFNEYEILDGLGSVKMQNAKDKATKEYEEFNKTQKIVSDFDKVIKKLKDKNDERRVKKFLQGNGANL